MSTTVALAVLRSSLNGTVRHTGEIERYAGKKISVAGLLSARRKTRTEGKREMMEFVTLEDERGLVECTLFPKTYERWGGRFRTVGPYLAEGKVEDRFGSCTLTVDRIRALDSPLGEF